MFFHFQGFLQVDLKNFTQAVILQKKLSLNRHDHNFLFLNTINQFALLTHSLSKY